MEKQSSPIAQASTVEELAELVKARKAESRKVGRAMADAVLMFAGSTVTRKPVDNMPNDYGKLLALRAIANKLRREIAETDAVVSVDVDGITLRGYNVADSIERESEKLGNVAELGR